MNKSFWKARVKPLIVVKCFPVLGFQQVVILEKEKNQTSNGGNVGKRTLRINKNCIMIFLNVLL